MDFGNKKLRVAVFTGGPSVEHEVSLMSGKKILEALNKNKYSAFEVFIDKEGKWPYSVKELKERCDIALLAAMHGEYGEDGTLQKILEKARIKFTGSGPLASKRGMDKVISDRLFRKARLLTANFAEFKKRQTIAKAIKSPFELPVAVKPADRGSSVGVSIVKNQAELPLAIVDAFKHSDRILIQEFIKGRELTCGVLEIKQKEKALPVTEIIPKASKFFDYTAKYTAGASEEVTPAKILPRLAREVQRAALTAHKAIGGSGYSRSDFILSGNNKLYILEINTLPGMTATSLVPQAAAAIGISFPKLLDLIIEAAW